MGKSKDVNLQNCIKRLCAIRISKIGGEYAPHKPLFIIYLLSLIYNGHKNRFTFCELDQPLSLLISNLGDRAAGQSMFPFWNLKNDGFWKLKPI
jgi:putative restriction endonuclease